MLLLCIALELGEKENRPKHTGIYRSTRMGHCPRRQYGRSAERDA